ncbi:DUF5677 domain-containing protein [Coraliomargarita algicola]|uniref:DUF5677 domain-containing protein n=1 Tax=Coraliomargarita algicola TaxID=3092156 RepID=A0ABZ0RRT5_9BACT|nr:DUF5677 domain-containing protein [Coraliomargarita sp. J2-16]WPJ97808.1 DUF5677 domain-containing protein [Coraliomargarita sp. J2-16]
MPDTPHKSILDRSIFRLQIEESFAPQLKLLEQMVNYGTNLVPRCFDSSDKQLPDIVCIGSFLKHAVSALDAIHILVQEGATTACQAHIRSIFEINLYIEWICQEDYEKRGVAYFVWNIRKKRYWNRCALEGTAEHKAHQQHMKGMDTSRTSKRFDQAELWNAVNQDDKRLQHPELATVNDMFEQRMKKSGKDVEWYVPFGVSGLRDIAIKLNKEAVYKVFFGKLSEATHGQTLEQQLYFSDTTGVMHFDHIRTLARVDDVFKLTFLQVMDLYSQTLRRYRPDEEKAFYHKYQNEWRDAYWRVPKVSKQNGTYHITEGEEPPAFTDL